MNVIFQPPGSKLCGHACVAMVAGVNLERAIEVITHEKSTKTKEIIWALRVLGVRVHKLKRGNPPKGSVSIAKAWESHRKKWQGWHWVVIDKNGNMLDPTWGAFLEVGDMYKITSYLEIHETRISNNKT